MTPPAAILADRPRSGTQVGRVFTWHAARVDGWRDIQRPHLHWAPSGLPGWLRSMPGWAARGLAEARVSAELVDHVRHLDLDVPGEPPLPHGTGAPVLVVPGFAFGDYSITPMRLALARYGWRPVTSGILANVDCSDLAVERLAERAAGIVEEHGDRIAVVGQSRGGMLARGLGARHPELVHRVVNLGGPLRDEFAYYEVPAPLVTVLRRAHHLDGQRRARRCLTADCDCPYMQAVHRPMPAGVELVSVFSKQDGVIDWRSCVVPGAVNVEVTGSHLGMGFHPETIRATLRALARPVPTA
jgi:pimeloyl-ACP methyl ester carboxylesterase